MSRRKRVLIALGSLAVAYPIVLLVLGFALRGTVEDRVRERLAYMLRADNVEIDDVDVSLLRGRIQLRGVRAERTSLGTASLRIAELDMRVGAMGLVLFDSDPRSVVIKQAHLELSAMGAATLRRSKGKPLHLDRLEIFDSSIRLVATSLFPSIGKAELSIAHARARDIELHNALAWLYKTELLDASLETTGDVELGLRYEDAQIVASGSFLGAEPISIPFVWPVPDPSKMELPQILLLGKQLLQALAPELARRKAAQAWDDAFE